MEAIEGCNSYYLYRNKSNIYCNILIKIKSEAKKRRGNKKKMKTKPGKKYAFLFLTLFVAALTVFALTGISSADTQEFYFHNTDYGYTPPIDGKTHACDKNMDKTSSTGSNATVEIPNGQVAWWYDHAAEVDSTFGDNHWGIEFFYTSTGTGTVTINISLVQNDGTIVKELASGSGSISPNTHKSFQFDILDSDGNQDFSVGQRLAVNMSYTGTGILTIDYDGAQANTHVDSPSTDPGFPVPEQPTIILTSTGLLALAGYVLYSRRRNNKSK